MNKLTKLLLMSIVAALLLALTIPALSQEQPGPGEGGPVIIANLGGDISTLNPILTSDASSAAVQARIFPGFIGVDPDTLNYAPGVNGSIVTAWEVSEDGLTYTFTLRDDWAWSDGTPITSADVKYGFDAISSGETNTPLTYILEDVADVQAPDATTLVITLKAPSCAALNNIAALPVIPSHVYSAAFPTFADMNESDFNISDPGATAGPFTFANFRPGEQVTLLADPNYPDGYSGYVVPEGWVYRNVPDQTLIFEQFLAGELTVASPPNDRKNEMRELGATGQAQVFETPATSVQFIAFNAADPTNPQNGLDGEGNAIDQGHHPIFGDLRVRQALMHAMDWEALNIAGLNSEGIQLASHILPTSWAFDPGIPFYEFDLAKADALLTEAGWVDTDGNPATPRVAQGAPYAADGTELSFELLTNAGNASNEAIGTLLIDQWGAVGAKVDFQPIDFNILVDSLLGQTFDAVMIFWGFGFPDDPNGARVNFDPTNDVVGGGFNVTSYNNPEFSRLMQEANTTPGCDQETRAELYKQAFRILRDDAPWAWISTQIVVSGGQPDVIGWNPKPGLGTNWNEDAWIIPTS